MSLKIHLIDKVKKGIDHQKIRRAASEYLRGFHLDNPEVGIHLVSAEEMRRINRDYRSQDKPTDVISFPIDEPIKKGKVDGEVTILGDIFLAPEMIKGDIIEIIIHGLTHLLGFDHKSQKEEEKFNQVIKKQWSGKN